VKRTRRKNQSDKKKKQLFNFFSSCESAKKNKSVAKIGFFPWHNYVILRSREKTLKAKKIFFSLHVTINRLA